MTQNDNIYYVSAGFARMGLDDGSISNYHSRPTNLCVICHTGQGFFMVSPPPTSDALPTRLLTTLSLTNFKQDLSFLYRSCTIL